MTKNTFQTPQIEPAKYSIHSMYVYFKYVWCMFTLSMSDTGDLLHTLAHVCLPKKGPKTEPPIVKSCYKMNFTKQNKPYILKTHRQLQSVIILHYHRILPIWQGSCRDSCLRKHFSSWVRLRSNWTEMQFFLLRRRRVNKKFS